MNKNFRYFIMLVLAIVIGYIACSTKFINNMEYRNIAWEGLSKGSYFREKFQHSWKEAKVEMINLNKAEKEKITVIHGTWGKLNYYLNQFNGGFAVSVTFRVPGSNSGGPYIIYINPFTKQVIGNNTVID